MTATVGQLVYHQMRTEQPKWGIKALPHVMIVIKKVLRRAHPHRGGAVFVADTPDTARDIEWLHSRYPLQMTARTATVLAERVAQYTARQQVVDDILAGRSGKPLLGNPARAPRKYQLEFNTLARSVKRMILGDDAGLGKSMSSILLLDAPDALPALFVVPTHLPAQWLEELNATWPELLGHVITRATPYDLSKIRGNGGRTPDVLFMSYSKLSGWAHTLAEKVRTVVFDECQELRHGVGTPSQPIAKGIAAAHVAAGAEYAIGTSATPVSNWGGEMWRIQDLLDPGSLGEWSEFTREWCGGQGVEGGKAIVTDPEAFGTYLRSTGKFLRRTRADVGRELPSAMRIRHEIDADPAAIDALSGDALAMARLVLDENADRKERWKAAGELDMLLRMATGVAKAPYVAAFVDMLLESERRVALFGWHRSVYACWVDRLARHRPVLYTGTESPRQKKESVDAFLHGGSRVLMMSLRSGAGVDGLQKGCSAVVFGELDWTPTVHDQCVWRFDRDGQPDTVTAYFLVSREGSDPVVEEALGLKRAQAEPIRNPGAVLLAPAPGGADRMRKLAQSVLDRAGGKGRTA